MPVRLGQTQFKPTVTSEKLQKMKGASDNQNFSSNFFNRTGPIKLLNKKKENGGKMDDGLNVTDILDLPTEEQLHET